MKKIINQLRGILSDTLIGWAFQVLPNDCEEREDLAYLIVYYMKNRLRSIGDK